jgi:protein-S-isoprenylcysteine O-methyltransferase Ste14
MLFGLSAKFSDVVAKHSSARRPTSKNFGRPSMVVRALGAADWLLSLDGRCTTSAHKEQPAMNRVVTLVYGAGSYLLFFLTFLYAIGFLGNVLVPKSLDSGPAGPLGVALLIDMGLLTLFAVQHSVMARPGFKRILTRVVSPAAERSTYVLASSLALIVLFWLWRPLGGVVWEVRHPAGRALLFGGFAVGWTLVLVTTFVINHFDLFGLRQAWRHFRRQQQTPLRFVTPMPYRVVRHPLYVGWLLAFWSTPAMTVTHLLFAAVTTAYILVAIQLEERDLMDAHPEYAAYRARVPMLVPTWRPRRVPTRATRVAGAEE